MEIKELVDHYKVLLNYNIIIVTSNGVRIPIKFTKDKFIHLAGINKLYDLKDMFYIKNGKPRNNILNICLNEQEKIKKSNYYADFKNRIFYFNMILLAVIDGKLENIKGERALGSKIESDYYIFKKINACKTKEEQIINFFISESKGSYYPVSFFCSKEKKEYPSNKYLNKNDILFRKISVI